MHDDADMDSEALLTFLTIHRTGGFSSAATALRRSQPAISRRIALLEDELGVPVFERVAGGVALSTAGRVLLPHAERVVAELRDAASAVTALRDESAGPVSLIAVGTLAGTNLTPVLRRFAAGHPGVELSLRTGTSADVSEAVRQGEAAIGLRYLLDPSADLVCERIASEPLCVACSADHPLAGKSIASLSSLGAEAWFAFPSAYEHRETFADNIFAQFQARGIGSIRWTPVDSLSAQKRLVEAGFGLALLPQSAVDEELRARSLATIHVRDLKAANPVVAVVRKGGYLSPAARSLMDLLRRTADTLVARPSPRGAPKRRKR
jgi:DNA-binding transcriptional LysR family regulator